MRTSNRTRGVPGRSRRDERGAAAIEFALVLIPLLVVVLGLIQYGFYFYAAQTGSNAANSAVRELAVGNCQTSSDLEDYVDGRIAGSNSTDATVTTTYYKADGSQVTNTPVAKNVPVGGTVKLTISFSAIDMNFPFVPFLNNAVVERTVQARVEDTTDDGCGV